MPSMQLIFEQIRTGGDRNFGYLLGDRGARQGVLIDPWYSPETLVQRAADQGLTITHVIIPTATRITPMATTAREP